MIFEKKHAENTASVCFFSEFFIYKLLRMEDFSMFFFAKNPILC